MNLHARSSYLKHRARIGGACAPASVLDLFKSILFRYCLFCVFKTILEGPLVHWSNKHGLCSPAQADQLCSIHYYYQVVAPQLVCSLAVLGHKDAITDVFLGAVSDEAVRCIGKFSAEDLCNIVWAAASVGHGSMIEAELMETVIRRLVLLESHKVGYSACDMRFCIKTLGSESRRKLIVLDYYQHLATFLQNSGHAVEGLNQRLQALFDAHMRHSISNTEKLVTYASSGLPQTPSALCSLEIAARMRNQWKLLSECDIARAQGRTALVDPQELGHLP